MFALSVHLQRQSGSQAEELGGHERKRQGRHSLQAGQRKSLGIKEKIYFV